MRFILFFFFFSSRRRHTRSLRDWSSDVCSSDLQRNGVAAAHGPRSLLGNPEEEAGACACLGEGGARPSLPHRRTGERVKRHDQDASARQHTGGPSPVPGSFGNRSRPGRADVTAVDRQIAELLDRSTQELRLAWRQLHRTGPPQGFSRDLLIRALAHQLQERAAGGTSQALRRRLQTLAGELEKRSASFDPGIVPKTGTTLVRQWRGHAHTVLVREDGFEYEGQHYRSLTVIAERITGAHWSGPRFFGLTKRTGASLGVVAGQ